MWLQSKLQSAERRACLPDRQAQNTDKKNNFLLRLCSGFCALISLFILGCASTEDIGVVQWEIEKLRSDVKDIKNRTQTSSAPAPAKPADEDRASRTAINRLEEQQRAADKSASETLASVQSLKSNIQSLTGRFEKLQSSSPVPSKPADEDRASRTAINRLEEQQRAADKSTSEILASVQSLKSDIQSLTGRFEKLQSSSPVPSKPEDEDRASRTAINRLAEQQRAADKSASETLASVQSLKSELQDLKYRYEKLRSDVKDINNRPQTSSAQALSKSTDEDRVSRTAINRLEEQQRAADKSTSETLASVQSLKSELQDLKYRYEKLRSDVKDLSAKSDIKSQPQALTAVKPADKSTSETLASVQSLKSELYNLKDRFEDNQYLSGKTLKELSDSQNTLALQVKGLETSSSLQAKLSLEEQKSLSDLSASMQALKTEIQGLKSRFEESQGLSGKTLKELSESQSVLGSQVKQLEASVNSKSASDLSSMQALKTDIQGLTGRFEESQNLSGKTLKELSDSQSVLGSQVKQLEASVNNKSASDLMSMQTLKTDIQGLKSRFEESQNLSGKTLKELSDSQNVISSQVKQLEASVNSKSASDLSSIQVLKTDIQGLKSRFEESQNLSGKTLKELTDSKNALAVQINALETKANAMSASELLMSVQALKTDIQGLTGRFEESQNLSGKTLKELTQNKNTLAVQIKELETRELNESKNTAARTKELEASMNTLQAKLTQLEAAVTALVNKPDETAEEKTQPKPKGTVKEVYTEAYKTYEQGRLDEAREQFQSVLNDYSENEFSGNARFWIGEIFYKQKNYGDAIIIFEEFLKKNPKSDKVPSALLKQGMSFYELKEDDVGKITLEKLINKHPKSSEAKIAREKLKQQSRTGSVEKNLPTQKSEIKPQQKGQTENKAALPAQVKEQQAAATAMHEEKLAKPAPGADTSKTTAKEPASAPASKTVMVTPPVSSQTPKDAIPPEKPEPVRIETQTAPVKADALAGETVSAEPAEKNVPANIENAYKKALQAYEDGQFDESRRTFQSFLRNYPENNYSDNARFWIGEAHYMQKNYRQAILAYEDLLKKNPASDKVPSALLKQGMSFHALNEKKAGDALLEKLVGKYPKSEQAMIAMKILKPPAPVTNPGSTGAGQQ